MKAVIVTGEQLSEAGRAGLAEFFHTRIVNEYGCTESGILAFECEVGTSHSIPFAALPEVAEVSPDASVRVCSNGEVLVTDLFGNALPLIRYRLRDRAILPTEAPCACGRELGGLQVGIGRSGAFLQLPSGRRVYSGIVSACVPRGIQRFQARQTAPDWLEVLVVPGVGFDGDKTVRAFKSELSTALGGEVTISIEVTDTVPPDPSGKLRHFIPLQP
jgi:phenylacetate-CoA ligase